MRVYRGDIDVKAIIEPGSSCDFIVAVGEGYDDWSATLIDTILDYVERDQRVARWFWSWRKRMRSRSQQTPIRSD